MANLTSRRRFILGSAGLGMLSLAAGGTWLLGKSKSITTLQSVVDTLIPRDEFPGGLDTGLDKHLLAQMDQRPGFQNSVELLLSAIEDKALHQYKHTFAKLTIDQREALLTQILNDRDKHQARRNLSMLRRELFTKFYTSEIGHQSLGFVLPSKYPAYKYS